MGKYVPHYTVDTTTKAVTSMSNKPVNPALQVTVSGGDETYDRWLWSKFDAPPHQVKQQKLRMKFADFDLGDMEGTYMLAGSAKDKVWVLSVLNGKVHAEELKLDKAYPLTDKAYSFKVEKAFYPAAIKTEWKNGTEDLLKPAIIATVSEGGKSERIVMELGKPNHYKTKEMGTIILLYRRQPAANQNIMPTGGGM
jgi:hypothetical protein